MLTANGRHIKIVLARHEKGWCFDFIHFQERVGEFHVFVQVFPGHAQLGFELRDVLVDTKHGQLQRTARPAGGRFKAGVGGNGVVGQNATIAPATDREFIRIGYSFGDGIVSRTQNVDHFFVTPVGINGFGKSLAAAGAAPVINGDDIIACARQHLRNGIEAVIVLCYRPAMNEENSRLFLIGVGPDSPIQNVGHQRAIFAF